MSNASYTARESDEGGGGEEGAGERKRESEVNPVLDVSMFPLLEMIYFPQHFITVLHISDTRPCVAVG